MASQILDRLTLLKTKTDKLALNRGALIQEQYFDLGWCSFERDSNVNTWIEYALDFARCSVSDPSNAIWMRHGHTWFVGVNALKNDHTGAVSNGPPLNGTAVEFINRYLRLGDFEWDRAQVSVCYPGYPRRSEDEAEAAHRYRIQRDAAHIDGLLRDGKEKRRFLKEYHGFILGIPMVEFSGDASPFVVWEKSHEIVRQRFRQILEQKPVEDWSSLDVTEEYHALRRRIFAECERTEIALHPGEVFLVHRLALHGMAPWGDGARAGADGRMICYFRPELSDPKMWLDAP